MAHRKLSICLLDMHSRLLLATLRLHVEASEGTALSSSNSLPSQAHSPHPLLLCCSCNRDPVLNSTHSLTSPSLHFAYLLHILDYTAVGSLQSMGSSLQGQSVTFPEVPHHGAHFDNKVSPKYAVLAGLLLIF